MEPNLRSTCRVTEPASSATVTAREVEANWSTPCGSLLPLMVMLAVPSWGLMVAQPVEPTPENTGVWDQIENWQRRDLMGMESV